MAQSKFPIGASLFANNKKIGTVTSVTPAPTRQPGVGVTPFALPECKVCKRRYSCPFWSVTYKMFAYQYVEYIKPGVSQIDGLLTILRSQWVIFIGEPLSPDDMDCIDGDMFKVKPRIFVNAYLEKRLWNQSKNGSQEGDTLPFN